MVPCAYPQILEPILRFYSYNTGDVVNWSVSSKKKILKKTIYAISCVLNNATLAFYLRIVLMPVLITKHCSRTGKA
jgi:hypothetical protein